MSTFRCSMFGHILYDDNLTFQDLLETEDNLKTLLQEVLGDLGARHFDFTAQSDALLFECVIPDMNRENNQGICDTIIRRLGPAVLARFTFMDHQMDNVAFYFLGRGKWKEQILNIPGPRQALSGWVVRQERKMPASTLEKSHDLRAIRPRPNTADEVPAVAQSRELAEKQAVRQGEQGKE